MNFFSERDNTFLTPIRYPDHVFLEGIVNTHTHPRDTDAELDGRAELHIPFLAEVYEIALGMGNTNPPLISAARAFAKRDQWQLLVPQGKPLKILVGGLMTEHTSPHDVVSGYDLPDEHQAWHFMKMFVRAASNANGADVDDMSKIVPTLKAMTYTKFMHRSHPMTLAIHMERKYDLFGRRLNLLLRERASVERDLSYLFQQVPDAKIVVCHVSDRYTLEVIEYLRSKGFNIWGELCPHYSMFSCDDLIESPGGGTDLIIDRFCLPVFKTDEDRRANEAAMVSGKPWWIHGCDDACWPHDPTQDKNVKVNDRNIGKGGQTQIPAANVSYVIEKFAEADRIGHLNGFLSRNARDAFGLPPSHHSIIFKRKSWQVPETIGRQAPHGRLIARVAMGGQNRLYLPEEIKQAA